jgi:stage II sporulation protein D
VGTSRVELRDGRGRRIGRFPTPLAVSGADRNLQLVGCAPINGIQDGHYRGTLEIRRSEGGGLTVVNELPVDEYLQGVIPGEVPPSWPAEALKAQAVAARSYALATNVADEVFDQYPDTRSQVYQGADAERPSTNAAARATALQVLESDGKVIVANFFSTSGGQTENVENGFAGSEPKPYLKSVEDPFDDISPLHDWRLGYTRGDIEERLEEYVKGKFRRIEVNERGVSPRIVSADIVGSKGRTEVSGATLKAELDLYDTWAYFRTVRGGRGVPDGPPEAPEGGGSPCIGLERVSLRERPPPKRPRRRPARRPPQPEPPTATLGASLGVIARG